MAEASSFYRRRRIGWPCILLLCGMLHRSLSANFYPVYHDGLYGLYRLAVVRCVRKGVQLFMQCAVAFLEGIILHIALPASYACPSISPILHIFSCLQNSIFD